MKYCPHPQVNRSARFGGRAVWKLVLGPFELMNAHSFNSTPFINKCDEATPGFTVESPSFTTAKVMVRSLVRFFAKTGCWRLIAAHKICFACRWPSFPVWATAIPGDAETSTPRVTNRNFVIPDTTETYLYFSHKSQLLFGRLRSTIPGLRKI